MGKSLISHLRKTDLFDSLNETQLEKVEAIAESATWPRGYELIKENDQSDALFVICHGSIKIKMNPDLISAEDTNAGPVLVAELREGHVFGEIALVDQGIRTATAITGRDDTLVIRLPREKLMQLCEEDKELGYQIMKSLAADLAHKMRNTGLTLRQYQIMLTGDSPE